MTAGLVLGLLVQPVLGAIAELHEVTSTGHVEVAASMSVGGLDSSATESGEPDPQQLVHHIAHCCGHVAAMATDELSVPRMVSAGSVHRLDVACAARAERWPAPFRPPIAS